MNISCNTFVSNRVVLNQYGNYITYWDYLSVSPSFSCTPFPQVTDVIKYRSKNGTIQTSTPPLPFVPNMAYDYTAPKEPIILIF